MIYVIGSGPAAVACCSALLKKGLQITMLDAGIRLEQENQVLLNELKQQSFEKWNSETINFFKKYIEIIKKIIFLHQNLNQKKRIRFFKHNIHYFFTFINWIFKKK